MPTNHFSFVGTHFKTSWDSKGTAIPLALGNPIGAGSALLAEDSKGDSVPLQILFLVRGQTIKGLSDCIGVNLVPEDFEHIIIFFAGKLFQYFPFFLHVIQEDCLLPAVQAVGFPEKSVCRFSSALEFLHEGFHRIFQIVLHPCGSADFLVGGQRRQ